MSVKRNLHRFFCTQCGVEGIPILRERGKKREAGHRKKLFCIGCGMETNHCEIDDIGSYTIEMFEEDFKTGKFTER